MARRSLAARYATLVAGLLSVALLASGTLEAWIAHRDRQSALETLRREKAQSAAAAVSRFIDDVAQNLEWVRLTPPRTLEKIQEERRLDYLKLLRLEPAITTLALLDGHGRERLRVSRIETDRIESRIDRSGEPGFSQAAGSDRPHFGEVRFVAETEPYLTIAMPNASRYGVILADVNLKFVQSVVSAIRVGTSGYAYVVDAGGRLVSHPDLSLVLQMRDLSSLPQVAQALAPGALPQGYADRGRDLHDAAVLSSWSRIEPLNWTVFIEQPRAEAYAPLMAAIGRSALNLVVALLLAVAIGVYAVRRMVAPIGALRRGAQRFGAGDLAHRIEVASGDELQDLAAQFNAMGERLRETYAGLEQRVAARTAELHARNAEITEALEQQTATAEILRVISASPTDAGPVFDSIVRSAARLCNASFAFVMLNEDGWLALAARTDCTAEFAEFLARGFPVDRHTTSGRAAFERRPVQVLDFMGDPEILVTPAHRVEGLRTVMAAPMLRDGSVLGVIAIWRHEVRAFSDQQVRLLEIFADQAVIAIENFRMFRRIEDTSRQLDLANQAKSRLLAAASHDLRQPMHALALYVDQLGGRMPVAERAKLTRRIEEAVGNLSELLDQLLDLSRLEAGAVEAATQDFAAGDLFAAVATQFAPLARSSGLALRVRAGGAWLRSDPVLVQRIVLNLVANALRYTERGGVLLACRMHGERVRIEVRDTGCGIPEDRRDDVFCEFVRLDNGAHRRASGLGLGLAIVARLAELLGTRIELRSRVGRGSLFAFDLPRGTPGAVSVPRSAVAAVAQVAGRLALVIDDDDAARTAMCGLLERWGSTTIAGASTSAALVQLAGRGCMPELIVSDYRLGGDDDGLQAVAAVRALAGRDVPAVLVTADTAAATLQAAQAAGVPVLHKPLSPMKLRALLAQLLAEREERAAA